MDRSGRGGSLLKGGQCGGDSRPDRREDVFTLPIPTHLMVGLVRS